jgi:hypothetical protein
MIPLEQMHGGARERNTEGNKVTGFNYIIIQGAKS